MYLLAWDKAGSDNTTNQNCVLAIIWKKVLIFLWITSNWIPNKSIRNEKTLKDTDKIQMMLVKYFQKKEIYSKILICRILTYMYLSLLKVPYLFGWFPIFWRLCYTPDKVFIPFMPQQVRSSTELELEQLQY